MGGGRWSDDTWKTYSSTHISGKSTDKIYTRKTIKEDFNPVDIKVRESRDSADNPNSTALIIAQDVTGSMSYVLDSMMRKGLPTLATEIYKRKPVSDPHIMFMGVGDVEMGDRYPLQVTQFEADIRIAEQLAGIFIEKGGGGNNYESYHLPWYFAGMYTSIDCFEKRGKKGYLFTVGDEYPPKGLSASYLSKVFNNAPATDMSLEAMLALATRMYNVYHVIVEEGSCASSNPDRVFSAWADVLGQNVLRLADHTKLSEVIVSAIQVNEGMDKKEVLSSWDGSTALVVDRAISETGITTANAVGLVELR